MAKVENAFKEQFLLFPKCFPTCNNYAANDLEDICAQIRKTPINEIGTFDKSLITVTKGNIAHFGQFLLLSKHFQTASATEASQNHLYVGKG